MFGALRVKMALAFGLIALLAIAAVGTGAFFLLRDREVQAASQRTGDLLPPEVATVGMAASRGVAPEYIAGYLRLRADQLDVRFILLDSDSQVIVDTAGKQSGRFTPPTSAKSGRNLPNSYRIAGWKEGGTQFILFQQPSGGFTLSRQQTVVPTRYNLLMLVPEASITAAWFDLAPRLGVAAALALVAALTLAYFVSRSVTRPIVRITHASEAMARGQYDQQIAVEGRDEVARLARSFNGMATQVSHSHQMMRDLLANVAHELKTPLTSIQGFSQALADGALRSPDEYANAGRIINEESERMRRLVNDLLYLSQIESGQAALDLQRVDPAALLDAAAERVQWQLSDSGPRLVVEHGEALPAVQVDPLRMEQVLGNLLDNALRHTPADGAITLRVRAEGGGVRLDVHNTGSYIPAEQQERVFERFYQIDRSRRRNGHNGGLGLAIGREIVVAHGGQLTVHSDPAAGTTFSIHLPAAARALPPALAAEQRYLAGGAASIASGGAGS